MLKENHLYSQCEPDAAGMARVPKRDRFQEDDLSDAGRCRKMRPLVITTNNDQRTATRWVPRS